MSKQGCSDGNCQLRLKPVTGQHTNADCRCLRDVPTQTRIAIQRKLQQQVDDIDRLQRILKDAHGAIVDAVATEDGMDGADGLVLLQRMEAIMPALVEDAN